MHVVINFVYAIYGHTHIYIYISKKSCSIIVPSMPHIHPNSFFMPVRPPVPPLKSTPRAIRSVPQKKSTASSV